MKICFICFVVVGINILAASPFNPLKMAPYVITDYKMQGRNGRESSPLTESDDTLVDIKEKMFQLVKKYVTNKGLHAAIEANRRITVCSESPPKTVLEEYNRSRREGNNSLVCEATLDENMGNYKCQDPEKPIFVDTGTKVRPQVKCKPRHRVYKRVNIIDALTQCFTYWHPQFEYCLEHLPPYYEECPTTDKMLDACVAYYEN